MKTTVLKREGVGGVVAIGWWWWWWWRTLLTLYTRISITERCLKSEKKMHHVF
jgi:hypothetical protein